MRCCLVCIDGRSLYWMNAGSLTAHLRLVSATCRPPSTRPLLGPDRHICRPSLSPCRRSTCPRGRRMVLVPASESFCWSNIGSPSFWRATKPSRSVAPVVSQVAPGWVLAALSRPSCASASRAASGAWTSSSRRSKPIAFPGVTCRTKPLGCGQSWRCARCSQACATTIRPVPSSGDVLAGPCLCIRSNHRANARRLPLPLRRSLAATSTAEVCTWQRLADPRALQACDLRERTGRGGRHLPQINSWQDVDVGLKLCVHSSAEQKKSLGRHMSAGAVSYVLMDKVRAGCMHILSVQLRLVPATCRPHSTRPHAS